MNADARPPAFFVLADGGPDHIDMSLPNGTRPSVPHDEAP